MASIVGTCPETGRRVPAGIEIEKADFLRLPNVHFAVRCPACGGMHWWWTEETFLAEAPVEEEHPRLVA